jgi:hypothetical protein
MSTPWRRWGSNGSLTIIHWLRGPLMWKILEIVSLLILFGSGLQHGQCPLFNVHRSMAIAWSFLVPVTWPASSLVPFWM